METTAAEVQRRLALPLAQAVRRARADRGWTLDEVARRSGLSRRLIVQIEQSQANPSIGTLLRLADAFAVTLSELLGEQPADAYSIQRAGNGLDLWTGTLGGYGRLLISRGSHELWTWILAAGESHESEPHRPGSHELLNVISGILHVDVGSDSIRLAPGDSAWIDATYPHAYRNTTARKTRFTMALFDP